MGLDLPMTAAMGRFDHPMQKGGLPMAFKIISTAFAEGDMIPRPFAWDGKDESPPLTWTDVPANTKSLALICDDPDAPMGTWVHWVLFNLPPTVDRLPEGVPGDKTLGNGGVHGLNDFGRLGYGGPCPPGGTHRYFFKLFALDAELQLKGGASKSQLLEVMEGHILAETHLMGRYRR